MMPIWIIWLLFMIVCALVCVCVCVCVFVCSVPLLWHSHSVMERILLQMSVCFVTVLPSTHFPGNSVLNLWSPLWSCACQPALLPTGGSFLGLQSHGWSPPDRVLCSLIRMNQMSHFTLKCAFFFLSEVNCFSVSVRDLNSVWSEWSCVNTLCCQNKPELSYKNCFLHFSDWKVDTHTKKSLTVFLIYF